MVDISTLLDLPLSVQANREGQYRVRASRIADGIRQQPGNSPTWEIRVIVRDYHNAELVSEPIEVTLADLGREEFR